MKYFHESKATGVRRQITKREAKEYLKSNYKEKVATFDEMLAKEGTIPCMFSNIIVEA